MISASDAAVEQAGGKFLDPAQGHNRNKLLSYPGDIARSIYTGKDVYKVQDRSFLSMKGIDDLQLSSKDLVFLRMPKATSQSQNLTTEITGRFEDNNLGTCIEQLQLRISQSVALEFMPQSVTYEVMQVTDEADIAEETDTIASASEGGSTDNSCCIVCNVS